MSNLRQRSAVTKSDTPQLPIMNYDEATLCAQNLLGASPAHSGEVMKLHAPEIYTFLPATIQWFISRCCPRFMAPQWKRRYLIAIGDYLYRFKDEGGTAPKGAPIAIGPTSVQIITEEDVVSGEFSILLDFLPPGYQAIFEVSSVAKTQYFAVQSSEDALLWVNTLKEMRQACITRQMGHSKDMGYPENWAKFDTSARRLIERKARINSRLEALNKKEQEMQTLGGSGVGYYS